MDLRTYIHQSLLESEKDKEESIQSEKDFREFAHKKMEAVFGDKLDEKRAKFTIDGFIDDNKDLVKNGDWGQLVGMFNKSFAD